MEYRIYSSPGYAFTWKPLPKSNPIWLGDYEPTLNNVRTHVKIPTSLWTNARAPVHCLVDERWRSCPVCDGFIDLIKKHWGSIPHLMWKMLYNYEKVISIEWTCKSTCFSLFCHIWICNLEPPRILLDTPLFAASLPVLVQI